MKFAAFQLTAWLQLPAFQLMGNMVKNGREKFYERKRGGTRPREEDRERIGGNWKNMEIRK